MDRLSKKAIIYSLQTTRHNRIFQGPKPFTLQNNSLSHRYGKRHASAPSCTRLSVRPPSLQPCHVLHYHVCYLLRNQGMHSKLPPVCQHYVFCSPSTSAPVPAPACTSASTSTSVSCSGYTSAATSSSTLPCLHSSSVKTILNFLSSPVQQHTSAASCSHLDLLCYSSQHLRKSCS
ncbi:hypothetical protein BZA77DRAFT_327343 [Pyronema omphalodes]|nr:hypothetical protein BZA77DRAFT_327343 [Pyronema omphalodes]